jgi:flagellar biosynthesis protein FliP
MVQTIKQNQVMPTLALFLMLGLVAPLILQVNYLARDVFLISEYKQKLSQITDNNEGLKISLAQSSSLENIDDYIQSKNFVKATQIKYVQILETSVVQNVENK